MNHGRRKRCASCDSVNLSRILDLGDSPLADDFPTTIAEAAAQPRFVLDLLRCADCDLVQLGVIVDDALLWHGDYAYHTSTSPTLVRHFEDYAGDVLGGYGMAGAFVVEVGSNDGLMLAAVQRGAGRVLGIDPARGPAEAATQRGVPNIMAQFGRQLAREVRHGHGAADVIIANNVIAHVADLDDFIGGFDELLSPGGQLWIEFQYLPDLVMANAFDMVYHEHRQYFRLETLDLALRQRGFYLTSAERVATQGGSMRVTASRIGKRDDARGARMEAMHDLSAREQDFSADGLQYAANYVAWRLREELEQLTRQGVQIVGWGAPAKATTLLAFTGIARYLDFVTERAPSKIGRFMPGTSVPIEDEAKIVDDGKLPHAALLALSWNMLPRLMQTHLPFIENGGRIVVPLPVPLTI